MRPSLRSSILIQSSIAAGCRRTGARHNLDGAVMVLIGMLLMMPVTPHSHPIVTPSTKSRVIRTIKNPVKPRLTGQQMNFLVDAESLELPTYAL